MARHRKEVPPDHTFTSLLLAWGGVFILAALMVLVTMGVFTLIAERIF